jgi:hypothetical protein
LTTLVPIIVFLLVVIPIAIAIHRSTELFVLDVEHGDVRFIRGRIPHALHRDICDILDKTRCTGRLRVTVERREAKISTRGDFDDGTLQRLRNVIGNTPLQRIRAGAKPARGRRR